MKIKDFVIRFANVNGTGSASANALTTHGGLWHGRAREAANLKPMTNK